MWVKDWSLSKNRDNSSSFQKNFFEETIDPAMSNDTVPSKGIIYSHLSCLKILFSKITNNHLVLDRG
jgi:hypothetical protein